MAYELLMPQLGLTMEEGTVSNWLKKEGEAIKVGEPILEITTDKEETAEHYDVEEEDLSVVATVMNALSKNFKEYRNIFFGSK